MADQAYPQISFEAVNGYLLPRFGTIVMDWIPGGKLKGREYVVRNPTRDDHNPGSFNINVENGVWEDFAIGDKGGDSVSLYAYIKGIGQVEAVKSIIEEQNIPEQMWITKEPEKKQPKARSKNEDWVPEPQEKGAGKPLPQEIPGLGRWTSSWPYRDEQGRLLFWVARVDLPEGEKKIRPVTWARKRETGKSGYRLMVPPPLLPLYRLNDLMGNPDRQVMIVEGEKAADAAQKLFPDMVVITSSGGSNAASKTDWGPLKDREVLISPDLDEPGEKYLQAVAEKAKAAGAKSIKRLDWPAQRIIVDGRPVEREGDRPKGYDLADALAEGWTAELVKKTMAQGQVEITGLEQSGVEEDEPPNPLHRELPSATEFPVEALGPVLAPAAKAIHNLTQAPISICCQSVLSVSALAVQGHADVLTPTGLRRPISLYLFSIAESGDRKSSADSHALKPIKTYESELKRKYEIACEDYQTDKEAWESQRKQILRKKHINTESKKKALKDVGPAPRPPLSPLVRCSEPTWEGLSILFSQGQPSLGLFSSEGGQFIGGHALNKDNRLKTVSALSSLWDGEAITRVRKSEPAMALVGRRFSLHLMVQPGVARNLLTDPDLADQGFLSRLLIAAPESAIGSRRYREPDSLDIQKVESYSEKILDILHHDHPLAEGKANELDPSGLPLSDGAKEVYVNFVDRIEERMAPNGGDLYEVRGLVNKMPEQALRIAVVLTLVRDIEATEIGREALAQGVKLAEFYTAEALRLYSAGVIDPDLLLAEQVIEWFRDKWGQPYISLPDLYQRGPKAIRDKKKAKEIMAILEEHGHLRRIEGGAVVGGKKRRDAYEVISS